MGKWEFISEYCLKCIIIIQVIMICLTSCEETLFEDEPTSPESSDEVEEHEHDLPDHFQTLKTEEELQNQFLQYANNIIEEIEDFERRLQKGEKVDDINRNKFLNRIFNIKIIVRDIDMVRSVLPSEIRATL